MKAFPEIDLSLSFLASHIYANPGVTYRQLVADLRHLLGRYDKQQVLKAFDALSRLDSHELAADCHSIQTSFSDAEKLELLQAVAAVSVADQNQQTAERAPSQPAGMPQDPMGYDVAVKCLSMHNLTARYPGKDEPDIQGISFSLGCGEMMAVIGPSGSGKSSIIRALLGQMHIDQGEISVNGNRCKDNILAIRRHLGYAPQDDILDPALTVYENLYFYQKLKSWSEQRKGNIEKRIENALAAFNMLHKKEKRVVSGKTKLSGGQRRRLNTAMELLNDPDVLILDEPTSGLSSRDSEQIVSLLKDLTTQGKMVLMVIHQPSSDIYKMFDKVLVLNKDGEQLYFGDPLDALDLFHEVARASSESNHFVECPTCKNVDPDLLLNVQEKESAEFWKCLGRILFLFNRDGTSGQSDDKRQTEAVDASISHPEGTMKDVLVQLPHQIRRQFLSKSRDRLNQRLTFVIPPLLGILIAFVFRLTPENETYSIVTNEQYPYFLFMIVITGMFLGLMAGVFEILKDKAMLKRESLSDVSIGGYFFSKFLILLLFAAIQSFLFLISAHLILGVRHMLFVNAGLMILITVVGIGFGLLFSTLTSSVLAAYNMVPLILIPQIILGGGFLPYTKMGEGLYAVERACSILVRDSERGKWPPNKYKAPLIARTLPASWAFELLVTANYHFHPVRRLKDEKQMAFDAISKKYDLLKAEGGWTESHKYQKRKEEAHIRGSYNPEIKKNEETLNKKIEEMGSEGSTLKSGEFKAQHHGYFNIFDGYRLFDEALSKTWALDGMVLLAYLFGLYAAGLVQVKRIIKKRR